MKQFSSLSRSIQGADLLETCAVDLLKIGHRPLVLCAELEYNKIVDLFVKSLTCHGLMTERICLKKGNQPPLEEVGEIVFQHKADFLIGIGDGHLLAAVGKLADMVDLPLVLIPTSMSLPFAIWPLDGDEEGNAAPVLPKELVQLIIVDRTLLLSQPTSALKAGLIQSLLYLAAAKRTRNSHLSSLVDAILIRECENVLLKTSLQALAGVEMTEQSKELQDIVEVLTVLTTWSLTRAADVLVRKLDSQLLASQPEWKTDPLKRQAILYLLLSYLDDEAAEKQPIILDFLEQLEVLPINDKSHFTQDIEGFFLKIGLDMKEIQQTVQSITIGY